MAAGHSVTLLGAPKQPLRALASHLKLALRLQQTPLVHRRRDGVLLAVVLDECDFASVQAAGCVTLFGVAVRLDTQAAVALAPAPAAPPPPPPEYAEIQKEYGAMAERTEPFSSMGSTPADWGYTPSFLQSLLGNTACEDQLLMVACGGGCPLALVPDSVALKGACIVDLGCGGGHDLALASHVVGPAGTTVGIDLTPGATF
jgi:hypothetical protein